MGKDRAATTALGIAANCVKTIAGDWYRSSSGTDGAGRRTIHVDTSSVSVTDFALDNAARGLLFANGQAAAKDFLARLPVS
jgi:NTE family protein